MVLNINSRKLIYIYFFFMVGLFSVIQLLQLSIGSSQIAVACGIRFAVAQIYIAVLNSKYKYDLRSKSK